MVKLKIDGLEVECEVGDAIEILLALREKEQKKREGQPTWIPFGAYKIPVQVDPKLPPYTITCGGTYPVVGDRPYISSTSAANTKGMV